MNLVRREKEIFHMRISDEEKIALLEEFITDCVNELEAEEQNMRPEIEHNAAEALRLAKDSIRLLSH